MKEKVATTKAKENNSSTDAESQQENGYQKWPFTKWSTKMDVWINIFIGLGVAAGGVLALVSLFSHWQNKETIGIWAFYVILICALTVVFLSWQKRIWEPVKAETVEQPPERFSIADRPHFVVSDWKITYVDGRLRIVARFTNVGSTPALRFGGGNRQSVEKPEKYDWLGAGEPVETSIITSKEYKEVEFVHRPIARISWDTMGTKEFPYYIDGEFRYSDVTGKRISFTHGYTLERVSENSFRVRERYQEYRQIENGKAN